MNEDEMKKIEQLIELRKLEKEVLPMFDKSFEEYDRLKEKKRKCLCYDCDAFFECDFIKDFNDLFNLAFANGVSIQSYPCINRCKKHNEGIKW